MVLGVAERRLVQKRGFEPLDIAIASSSS